MRAAATAAKAQQEAFLRYGARGQALPAGGGAACRRLGGRGLRPAFTAIFLESMADGGVACGLPRASAIQYAAQMMLGTAKMVLETNQHPGVLKDSVCSPAGSTIQGVRTLEERGMRAAVLNAVTVAYEKTSSSKRRATEAAAERYLSCAAGIVCCAGISSFLQKVRNRSYGSDLSAARRYHGALDRGAHPALHVLRGHARL